MVKLGQSKPTADTRSLVDRTPARVRRDRAVPWAA
jgi:hypothetical protein